MLARSLYHSLRHAVPKWPTDACAVCTCVCGLQFAQQGPSRAQQRQKVVWLYDGPDGKTRRTSNPGVLPQPKSEQVNHDKVAKDERIAAWYRTEFAKRRSAGELNANIDSAVSFLKGFLDLAGRIPVKGMSSGKVHVDIGKFETLVRTYNINPIDLATIARMLLEQPPTEETRSLGKRMIFTMSNAGYDWATENLMRNALREHKLDKQSLKRPEYKEPLKHLREAAAQDRQWRLQLLDGRISYELGDYDAAIKQWTNVMGEAVAAANDPSIHETNNDLSALWIELSQAYSQKKDYEKARSAISIGCDLDDPSSHYIAAGLEAQKMTLDPHRHATSKWLYHMTKAAASGQVKAVHEMGIFYALSEWKYIEDEPPDQIKPTPFDSYPAGGSNTPTGGRMWKRTRSALGLVAPADDPVDDVFHSTAFPHTPYGRFQMALKWLEVGMGFLYVPSYLLAAKLLLEKTLRSSAAAPRAALELSDERYRYASYADFGAKIPMERPDVAAEEANISNPGYHPSLAKSYLREVFFAQLAMQYVRAVYNKRNELRYKGDKTSAFNPEPTFSEDALTEVMNTDIRKWFRFPEVRRLYMDEANMRLYDTVQEVNVIDEAINICNAQGWDMLDDDGGLLYKHGSLSSKGSSTARESVAATVS